MSSKLTQLGRWVSPSAGDQIYVVNAAGTLDFAGTFTQVFGIFLGQANTFTVGPQTIQTGADGNKGLIIKSNSPTQAANAFELQNSDGTFAYRLLPSGYVIIGPDTADDGHGVAIPSGVARCVFSVDNKVTVGPASSNNISADLTLIASGSGGNSTQTFTCLHVDMAIDTTASFAGRRLIGINVQVDTQSSPATLSSDITAIRGFAYSGSAINAGSDLLGMDFIANLYDVGTVRDLYGVRVSAEIDAGTCRHQYGVNLSVIFGGGTQTGNSYGVYISSVQGGTSQWQLYAADTTPSYFGGPVGIGQTAPNAKVALQVDSTTKGVLFPRMTTTQRDAITTPPEGLIVYNTTTHKLNLRTAAAWEQVTSA